jgi:hypothetical protein
MQAHSFKLTYILVLIKITLWACFRENITRIGVSLHHLAALNCSTWDDLDPVTQAATRSGRSPLAALPKASARAEPPNRPQEKEEEEGEEEDVEEEGEAEEEKLLSMRRAVVEEGGVGGGAGKMH